MFLFDTDVISQSIRRAPPVSLVTRMRAIDQDSQFVSTITLGELLTGANLVQSPPLFARIEDAVAKLRILAFDEASARQYGPIAAYLRSVGRPIGVADTQIAAIALANDLTVVTGNTADFSRVPGLRVENWL